jgi:hypothetical protein
LGIETEQAILTQWGELFRTGLLAWGLDLNHPDPPRFHVTSRGRQALANATRDPSNPLGYIRHLESRVSLNDVARSYVLEAVDCYAAGFFKASAVLVGAAAESLVLELAENVVTKLKSLQVDVPKGLVGWKVKEISNALQRALESQKTSFPTELRESFEAYWAAFVQQIRAVRNDAGHPKSVEPVTSETVHASLLVFPELAQLMQRLSNWVTNDWQAPSC